MVKPEQPAVGMLDPEGAETGSAPGELYAYRLVPAVGSEDTNWDLAPNHGVIEVNALSPADARVVAAEAEVDFLETDARPGDGTSTRHASAFRTDKLYSVVRIGPAKGKRGMITVEND